MAAVSRTRVNFHDQNSVRGYIESLLFSAGECLRTQGVVYAQLNREAFDRARPQMPVESRPIVIHLFEIIDNGHVGWFGSKNITLFSNLINIKWPSAPKKEEKLSKAEEEKRKKENQDFWNSLIGSAVSVAAAVLTGFTYDEFATQTKTLQKTEQAQNDSNILQGPLQQNFQQLIEHQWTIDNLNARKATHYFYASVIGLAGGIGWGLGGFMSAPGLSTLGKMALAAAGIWGGVNLGRHWKDHEKIHTECLHINAWAQSILYWDMPLYNPDMSYRYAVPYVPADAPPPSFVPDEQYPAQSLYPQLFNVDMRPPDYSLPSTQTVD